MDSRFGSNWELNRWQLDLKLQAYIIYRQKERSGLNVLSVHACTGQCGYLVICYYSSIPSYGYTHHDVGLDSPPLRLTQGTASISRRRVTGHDDPSHC